MKKSLCILISAVMVFSIVTTAFSASDSTSATDEGITTEVATVYCSYGEGEIELASFDTLGAAFDAVGLLYNEVNTEKITDSEDDDDTNTNNELYAAAGSPVIRLNGSFKGTSVCPDWVIEGYDKNYVPTIVVDGAKSATENYVITCDDITLFDRLAFYNLTVRNTDMVFNRTDTSKDKADNNIRWNGNIDTSVTENPRIPGESFTVFENCKMDQNSALSAASGSGGLFKMNGFKKAYSSGDPIEDDIYNLTLKDCTIFSDSAVGLQVHWGADANIYLKNTTWTMDGVAGCSNNNDVILKCYEAGNVYMNIDGTSELIGAREDGALTIALIRNLDTMAGKCIYELEAGALLYMNNSASTITEQHFIATACANSEIIDHGAILRASEQSVQSSGVTLPSVTSQTACAMGYFNNNVLYTNGKTYSVPGDYAIMTKDAEGFGMVDGAAIRSVKGEYGIRFSAFMTDEFLAKLGADAKYGIVIAPGSSSMDNPATSPFATEYECKVLQKDSPYGENVFHAAIIFDETADSKYACTTSYVARAYYTVKNEAGEDIKIYSVLTDNNARSIYQVAQNLKATDEAYANSDLIEDIFAAATRIGADEIITSIAPDTTVLKSSTTCNEIILSNADRDAVMKTLLGAGFTVMEVQRVYGAKFEVTVLKSGTDLVTLHWNAATSELRIMWESLNDNAIEVLYPNAKTNTGTVQVAQIGVERVTERDNPLNGMCYIVKLSNGNAFIIDGGTNDACATNIYDTLGKLGISKDENGKYIIEGWLITHLHGDHYGAFEYFGNLYSDNATLKYLLHNLPGDSKTLSDQTGLANRLQKLFPEAKRINPHSGLKYYFDNMTLSMLYTPELLYSYDGAIGYANDSSLIFRVEAGGASALFYGDSGEEASKAMWNSYDPSAFKVDILQINHHGLYTSAGNGHTWEYVKKVYEATEATYAVLPMHSKYGPDTRNGRFTVMIQWCNSGYQISYVMNESDNHGKSSIDQAYYNAFVEAVKNGANEYDTLYGYDGINKIVNENGLITFTGGNNYTPMATVFEFAGGEATLTVNSELYTWLAENTQEPPEA